MSYALVFDLSAFDHLGTGAVGHALGRRVSYRWQSPLAICGIAVPLQNPGRRFEPSHPHACERCRAIVLHLQVSADVR